MTIGRIEISHDKKESLKQIFVFVFLAGLSVLVLAIAGEQQEVPVVVAEAAAWLLLLIVVPLLAYVLYRMSDNTPRITLDFGGLTDNSSAASPGFIAWRDIEGFEVRTIYNVPFLGIVLKDPGAFHKSANPITRFLNRLNNTVFKSSYLISVKTLDIEFDEFEELVRAYHQKYSG